MENKDQTIPLTEIKVRPHGSYIVNGVVKLIHEDGLEEEKQGPIYLCRCGGSGKKPFCDGTHKTNGF